MSHLAATTHPAMQLSQRVRTLVLAAAAALAIASIPAVQAHAATIQPNLCVAQYTDGLWFFLPGEKFTDKDGNKWVCGPDGKWFRDYSSLQTPPTVSTSTLTAPLSTSILVIR